MPDLNLQLQRMNPIDDAPKDDRHSRGYTILLNLNGDGTETEVWCSACWLTEMDYQLGDEVAQ